ncbi:accessory gene regulator B [Roseburia sp. CAG:309]|nr:accessory gene regulator B [Roseburia sp. CAG:309]
MRKKLKNYLQTQFHFSSLEADRILYGFESIVSEAVKFVILFFIALPLGYADEMLVATIVLLSIRSNSGGLHFSHFFSCLAFTVVFYTAAIGLAQYPLSSKFLSLGLILTLGVFAWVGPITSIMRPRLQTKDVQRYSRRVIFLLLIYSSILITFETLPYRNVIYWVIVLQIFQLLCARIARKGEIYEEVYDTKNL